MSCLKNNNPDKKLKNILFFLPAMLLSPSMLTAQVQVSKEPMHKKVLENKYIRLLDVWVQPGDTSLFHIHSTPSVFLQLTNTTVASQVKGQDWVKDQSVKGNAWYRSFLNDTLVHRVSNRDTVPFHVNDIEILSPYSSVAQNKLLPFTVLFENEKAVAYRLTNSSLTKQIISRRGPLIAELAEGADILFHDANGRKSVNIRPGKYLYIKPGRSFYFSAKENEKINLVLFEIK